MPYREFPCHRDGDRQQKSQRGPQQASASAARNARVRWRRCHLGWFDARRHRHKRHNRLAECNCRRHCGRGRQPSRVRESLLERQFVSADVAVVDQVIDRLLHVHAGRNDAGLLQGEAGLQDQVALRRADLVVRELRALLELLVDHCVGELGAGDEDALFLVIVGERIFARVLVDREHAPHDVGMVLEELLARIEDAPGIGLLVAIEQLGAVGDLGLRHHRVEPRPGIDVAADERGLAVRMLQQHRGDVLLGQPDRLQRAHQEDVRIGAARHGDALALEVGDLGDRRVLAVTSAVHSGRE